MRDHPLVVHLPLAIFGVPSDSPDGGKSSSSFLVTGRLGHPRRTLARLWLPTAKGAKANNVSREMCSEERVFKFRSSLRTEKVKFVRASFVFPLHTELQVEHWKAVSLGTQVCSLLFAALAP